MSTYDETFEKLMSDEQDSQAPEEVITDELAGSEEDDDESGIVTEEDEDDEPASSETETDDGDAEEEDDDKSPQEENDETDDKKAGAKPTNKPKVSRKNKRINKLNAEKYAAVRRAEMAEQKLAKIEKARLDRSAKLSRKDFATDDEYQDHRDALKDRKAEYNKYEADRQVYENQEAIDARQEVVTQELTDLKTQYSDLEESVAYMDPLLNSLDEKFVSQLASVSGGVETVYKISKDERVLNQLYKLNPAKAQEFITNIHNNLAKEAKGRKAPQAKGVEANVPNAKPTGNRQRYTAPPKQRKPKKPNVDMVDRPDDEFMDDFGKTFY